MASSNPALSMAFAVQNGPRQYALLLGSGVATGAGILTGWGVAVDLARRIPGAPTGSDADLEKWFEGSLGLKLDYTAVMEELGKSGADRLNLLRPYFEPSDLERKNGVKVPSKAHKAVAELVKAGFFRVIITTNFDRLLEQALRAVGIEPVVLHHESMISGAMPYAHTDCLVLKLHGDYLDTRLLNTNAELATYPDRMASYLDRLLEDHGLIICGWSAEYDPALVKAICEVKDRKFSTYWLQRGWIGKAAQKVIDATGAIIIPIDSADEAFSLLLENVKSLRDINKSNVMDLQVMSATAKRHIQDKRSIDLYDLVMAEVDDAVRILTSSTFDANLKLGVNEEWFKEFKTRVKAYDEALERTVSLLGILAYHGSEEHHGIVRSVVERLASTATYDGYELWSGLKRYPMILAVYCYGTAAVAAERWENLKPILYSAVFEDPLRRTRGPLVLECLFARCFKNETDQWLRSDTATVKQTFYTPVDDYLAVRTAQNLAALGVNARTADVCYDKFHFMLQVAYIDHDPQGWAPVGRWWKVMREEQWNRSGPAEIARSVASEGDKSRILESGAAGRNSEKFAARTVEVKELLVERAKRF